MSPERRAKIERSRELVCVNSPFRGKNRAQRARLHAAFAECAPKVKYGMFWR